MLTGQLYRQVRDRFREEGLETPDLDARVLVSAALGLSMSDLVLRDRDSVPAEHLARALAFADRRLEGMPPGRILGERDFYGRRFLLNAATLEPRPDTETLVDAVLERTDADAACTLCDIGTGSGVIAVSLLAELPKCHAIAVDLSEEALDCAVRNAELNNVGVRFLAVCGDYGAALRPAGDRRDGSGLDWVVSNPPYIRTADLGDLSKEVRAHDPALALDGGASGLEAYIRIVAQARDVLRPGGRIALEFGWDQAGELEKLLQSHDFDAIEVIRDLAGNERVATARRK